MAGDTSAYNGTSIVARSVELKTPIVYVSFNYRLNGTFVFIRDSAKQLISHQHSVS